MPTMPTQEAIVQAASTDFKLFGLGIQTTHCLVSGTMHTMMDSLVASLGLALDVKLS